MCAGDYCFIESMPHFLKLIHHGEEQGSSHLVLCIELDLVFPVSFKPLFLLPLTLSNFVDFFCFVRSDIMSGYSVADVVSFEFVANGGQPCYRQTSMCLNHAIRKIFFYRQRSSRKPEKKLCDMTSAMLLLTIADPCLFRFECVSTGTIFASSQVTSAAVTDSSGMLTCLAVRVGLTISSSNRSSSIASVHVLSADTASAIWPYFSLHRDKLSPQQEDIPSEKSDI